MPPCQEPSETFNQRRARETRERADRAHNESQRELLLQLAAIFEARHRSEQKPLQR